MAISERKIPAGAIRLDEDEYADYCKVKSILDRENMKWRDFVVKMIRQKIRQAERKEQKATQ